MAKSRFDHAVPIGAVDRLLHSKRKHLMSILNELRSRFETVLSDFTDDPHPFAQMVRPSQDARHGDFQANCAMPLAAQQGTDRREVALKIVDKLDVNDLCEPPEIAGPGFINLRLRDDWIRKQVNAVFHDERLGVETAAEPQSVVIDFSSPNVAKPMHVGHLRSTVIGDALQRTLRFLGHNVTSDNHIGDWGTQFGMIIYGYKNFLDPDAYEADPVPELSRLYRLVNTLSDYHSSRMKLPQTEALLATSKQELETAEQSADPTDKKQKKELKKLRKQVDGFTEAIKGLRGKIGAVEGDSELLSLAEQHPDIARLAREETAKLHADDAENLALWNQVLPQCLSALQRVYDRLNIHFDLTLGESHYNPQLAGIVEGLEEQNLAKESDGAKCVFIEGNAAPFIVQKADGAYTYATTDLATIQYRVNEIDADTILYVVDARQAEHFNLLFATAAVCGLDDVELTHVSFGTVLGKDGKPYKTREGDAVGLESLLDEAIRRAKEIVSTNDDAKPNGPELDDEARDQIAEIVGLGGVKYADLHHNRESDYRFDWKKMLATTGDTATYMQYAYARVHGIFRRGDVDPESLAISDVTIEPVHEAERALSLKVLQFGDALADVVSEYKPNLLTQYLFELAGILSTFYDRCSVLKAEDEATQQSRLKLVWLTGRVIRQGLELLGIETSERM